MYISNRYLHAAHSQHFEKVFLFYIYVNLGLPMEILDKDFKNGFVSEFH